MRYEGPVYRPPSEANSLLVQTTIGCPHNKCTFCMVYKRGPRYKSRPLQEIKADLWAAREIYGKYVRTIFLPAGNSIAMATDDLVESCKYAHELFPNLDRITVYGSSQYILQKGPDNLKKLRMAGLTRIHVGLESGDNVTLSRIKKGVSKADQIKAGQWLKDAEIEVSLYVILGIGGTERTYEHATETADALNEINPDFIRFRTFMPKIHTPLLRQVKNGFFQILTPHAVLREMALIVDRLEVSSFLACDHYTNYLQIEGQLPQATKQLLFQIETGLKRPESEFRPFCVGTE